MSRIRSKDTRPEMIVRRGLHARGFRYRLHGKDLPGKPDLILPRWNAVIQIHGCFWHGHVNCGRAPKTNRAYWESKIERNRERDEEAAQALRALGWRLLVVWECCLGRRSRADHTAALDRIAEWIRTGPDYAEFESTQAKNE